MTEANTPSPNTLVRRPKLLNNIVEETRDRKQRRLEKIRLLDLGLSIDNKGDDAHKSLDLGPSMTTTIEMSERLLSSARGQEGLATGNTGDGGRHNDDKE
ncbi:hypothetical protein ACLOJK_008878 [Asimina triloba]